MFNKNTFIFTMFFIGLIICFNDGATAKELIESTPADVPESWAVHGQITNVIQWHPQFSASYSGENSLAKKSENKETTDLTLFIGRRLWKGGEFWLNPEIEQGFGLSNTVGVAGYPSGEAYKVGANHPYLRLPRAFVRHTIELDGDREELVSAANQLSGMRSSNNIVITAGRFSVIDVFDNNSYAHDPRADFLNWSVIDAGAFDYAADAWGFTNGAAIEWTKDSWTLRGGIFQLSGAPNAKVTGLHFRQYSLVSEVEKRTQWKNLPGKIKLLAFMNRGDMASYRDAVELTKFSGESPDLSVVRHYASRLGLTMNVEQDIAPDMGLFLRASLNDGSKEAYEFTEINRSLSGGVSMQGKRWGRQNDRIGLAVAVNALSSSARDYFSAGGSGILIGDGRLNYGKEKIIETFYALQANAYCKVSFDYQHIVNPAYNKSRGPVSFLALRFHGEF